jgi:hypothetical protein
VVELPAASGEATADDSEVPLELELAPPPPPLPDALSTTRTVPCMFGWIVQM